MKTKKTAKKLAVTTLEQIDRRGQPRHQLLWQARLQCGSHEFDCWVYDLSFGGAKVRFDLPLAADCAVVLDIPEFGAISARVVWSVAGQMGVEFIRSETTIRTILGKRAEILGLS